MLSNAGTETGNIRCSKSLENIYFTCIVSFLGIGEMRADDEIF